MRYADMLYLQQLESEKQMAAHRRSADEKFQQIAQYERELLEEVAAKPKTANGVVYREVGATEMRFGYYEDEEEGY
jgi:hypothetical protein